MNIKSGFDTFEWTVMGLLGLTSFALIVIAIILSI